jgi:hypothetical protein
VHLVGARREQGRSIGIGDGQRRRDAEIAPDVPETEPIVRIQKKTEIARDS